MGGMINNQPGIGFTPMQGLGNLGGFNPAGQASPLAGGPAGFGQPPGAALQANENLGSGWQGVAGGGDGNLGALQQAFGGIPQGGAQDQETKDLLQKRPDLTAKDLDEMKGELRTAFKSPAMQDAAYKKALQTLSDGGNSSKPQDLGKMLSQMSQVAGPKGGAAALDMFDQSQDLLKAGHTPQDIGKLAEGAGAIGGGEGSTPGNLSDAFKTSADTLKSRPGMKPGEVSDMAKVVAQRFPGKDPTDRMQAFQQGSQMMGQHASMDAKGIDNMLARGQEQGLKGTKLLRSFETQGKAMQQGAISANAAQDKATKNLSFDKQGNLQREKGSSDAAPGQKMQQLGQPSKGSQTAEAHGLGSPQKKGPEGATPGQGGGGQAHGATQGGGQAHGAGAGEHAAPGGDHAGGGGGAPAAGGGGGRH